MSACFFKRILQIIVLLFFFFATKEIKHLEIEMQMERKGKTP